MDEDDILDGPPGENEGGEQDSGYDESSMGEVLTADQYRNSPAWFKERMGHMARVKREAQNEAGQFRAQLAQLQAEFGEIRGKINQPAAAPAAEQDKPFVKKASEEQLRAAATKIMGLQDLSRDPDVTQEERLEARKQLAGLGDAPSVLFDIQQEIADRRAMAAAGSVREEFAGREQASAARSALVNKLFSSYGTDAINQNSALAKAAFAKLAQWSQQHGIPREQVNDFMTLKAFEEAAAEQQSSRKPGQRGADPRSSAVLGSNGNSRIPSDDPLPALEAKAKRGDWRSARKAMDLKMDRFLKANGIIGAGNE